MSAASKIRTLRPMARSAFDAATTAQRSQDWDRVGYGPNSALDDSDIARARSQDAVRNNPWIAHALRLLVSHTIGCGIQPRPVIDDPAIKTDLLDLWEQSLPELDADGATHFYGLQTLITRARHESGEVFIRLRPRRLEDGLAVPLQVQAIESDLLPTHHNSSNGGNRIRQGIEITPYGKRVAYWFYPEHPGDRNGFNTTGLSRVPAEAVLHHYEPQRPGQLRGVPTPHSSLYRARNLDGYEIAELARKKARAKFVGAIYKENPEDNPLTDKDVVEDDSRAYVDIEDAYMLQLKLRERVTLESSDSGGSGAMDFVRTHLRAIASGMGVPFELMTGDYSGTNDRIMRVILNAFYRDLEIAQERLINQVLQPIWAAWMDAAWLSGAMKLPNYAANRRRWQRCQWRAHAWSYVNPLQEAQTAVLRINNGLTSRSAVVAESGWDAEDIDRQQAEDHAREESLDLHYGDKAPIPADTNIPDQSGADPMESPA